jgi:hypothetical protein
MVLRLTTLKAMANLSKVSKIEETDLKLLVGSAAKSMEVGRRPREGSRVGIPDGKNRKRKQGLFKRPCLENWRCETLKVLPELTFNSLGRAEFLKNSGMTRSQTSWKLIKFL